MPEYRAQDDYFEHLSQSIKFLHARNRPNRDRRRQRLTAAQQIFAICFLFVTPFIFIGKSLPETDIQPIAINWHFMENLTHFVARLGHGDVLLLFKCYAGILVLSGVAHLYFVDKRTIVLASSRGAFRQMRSLAVSYAACQDGTLGKLSWFVHRRLVTTRRRIRGAAYRAWTARERLLFVGILAALFLVAGVLISAGVSIVFNVG